MAHNINNEMNIKKNNYTIDDFKYNKRTLKLKEILEEE